MATPKGAPKNFASLTSEIVTSTVQPQQQEGVKPKDKLTSFELKGELRLPLDRVVHGLGKKGSLKNVINEALRYYFENETKAKRLAETPTPDEEPDEA